MNNLSVIRENTFSLIPNDIFVKEIFPNFEHKELTNLRLVSKEFRKNLDNDALFEEKDLKMKKSWESVLDIQDRIEFEKNNLRKIQNKIEKKNTPLKQLTASWFGFFVSLLSWKICVILKIKALFIRLFPSVATEEKKQSVYRIKISNLQIEKRLSITNLATLTKDEKLIMLSHKIIEKEYEIVLVEDKIKNLFGGRRNFEKLPILDIGNRTGSTGYIDFIKDKEMSAPIMRGKDCHGREFFSIRARSNVVIKLEYLNSGCQTFFKRYTDMASWTDGGFRFIQPPTYLIKNGNVDKQSYDQLKKFIEERGNNQYSIC
ncbi:MAG: hypothetical protein H0W50_02045 [Parachlamydiaceae bacterium]|nr:hypothetical protein [Parachlamydiaceae bacterium]